MEASIGSDVCVGCGACVDICPEVFEMSEDDDVAEVKVDEVPEDAEESCREAVESCPVEAITIED